jgi:hypothetical protein
MTAVRQRRGDSGGDFGTVLKTKIVIRHWLVTKYERVLSTASIYVTYLKSTRLAVEGDDSGKVRGPTTRRLLGRLRGGPNNLKAAMA